MGGVYQVEKAGAWPGMRHDVKKFLQRWVICTLAVLVATYLVKGIHCATVADVCVAALLLGILNAGLRPVLMFLTFPLLLLSFGLFQIIINATLLYFVGYVLRPHFYVDSFWSAIWGALVISIISLVLNTLTGTNSARVRIGRHRPPPGPDGGSGPVIDV